MHRMFAAILACCALSGLAGAAQAQDDNGWDYREDAVTHAALASVAYAGGQGLAVQCLAGDLLVLLEGVPHPAGQGIFVNVTRADGRADHIAWYPQPAGDLLFSDTPGRNARFLRGGGALVMRSPDGAARPMRIEMDLPSDTTNLDRVLTTCGRHIDEPRDRLPQATQYLKGVGRIDAHFRRDETDYRTGSAEISCVVDARSILTNCQLEQEWPVGSGFGRAAVLAARGVRVETTNRQAITGTVVYITLLNSPDE